MAIIKFLNKCLTYPLIVLIWVYQKTLSPDHGPLGVLHPYGFCKFYPSCSMYAKEVLQTDGLIGLRKIIRRFLACRPSSLGGVDLP